jgi:hypothetical protein
MPESIIDYAMRVQDRRNGVTTEPNATIESLVILAESDLPVAERRQMIAKWRELRLI